MCADAARLDRPDGMSKDAQRAFMGRQLQLDALRPGHRAKVKARLGEVTVLVVLLDMVGLSDPHLHLGDLLGLDKEGVKPVIRKPKTKRKSITTADGWGALNYDLSAMPLEETFTEKRRKRDEALAKNSAAARAPLVT